MMNEGQHREIVEEVVHLSIGLLLGGNGHAQEMFLKEMSQDPSNALIVRVKERLDGGFEQIKKTMNQYNKKLFEELVNG